MRGGVGVLGTLLMGIVAFVASGQPAAAQGGTPIKIGHINPVTGASTAAGKDQRQSAEVAVEQINAAGGVKGRPLQLVEVDDQSTAPGAVAALQRLLADPEVVGIVGPIFSGQIQAMLPAITQGGRPVMTGAGVYGLTRSGSRWLFRCRPHDGISAQVHARFVVEDLKLRKPAIIHSADAFGSGGRDLVAQALTALGAEPVLVQAHEPRATDYTAQLTALKQSGADVLITYMSYAPDVGALARQLRQQGLTLPWVGSASVATGQARQVGGEALHGTYAVADFHPEANPQARAFVAAYRAKYGTEPILPGWPYDAVTILAEAIKRAPDLKPESLRAAILSLKAFPGVEGEYTFDENGDGLDHYHVVKNEGGTVKLVKTLRVERERAVAGSPPASGAQPTGSPK
jgi:branched-chain amino acid transport system substrate-binding protein